MAGRLKYFVAVIVVFLITEILLYLCGQYINPKVLIYMYHSVSDEPLSLEESELSVIPAEFEKQLAYFSKREIPTLFADELPDRSSDEARCVVLTFDDGYEDNYTEVFPLLKKYNCKATIFMIASLIDTPGYLSSEQIREMTDSGLVSIQSHTVYHLPMALGGWSYEAIDYELGESKRIIEDISGRPVTALAMPNGSYDPKVIEVAEKYYNVAFTGTDFRVYSPDELMDIHRVGIYRRHRLSDVRRLTDNRGVYFAKRFLQKLVGAA
ncbi:MAG: polysaccharide deacetylase family protein [Oscillospiraceae bacterium]|nr:polysaccharide deacetylase family protein [Oscillospiraceae bacterium]